MKLISIRIGVKLGERFLIKVKEIRRFYSIACIKFRAEVRCCKKNYKKR